jgi:hypothetical protein
VERDEVVTVLTGAYPAEIEVYKIFISTALEDALMRDRRYFPENASLRRTHAVSRR